MTRNQPPDTIILIHGFWVTPRSWEPWIAHYEQRGFRVLAPAYPGLEVEVEALNADPTPLEALTVPAIIDSLELIIKDLDAPPILMGHSAGGAFLQVLLDHGYGACGVAMNSAPTEGVRAVPLSQVRATFPVLKNPANHHRAVALNHKQWHYAFTNTFTDEDSQRLYDQLAVPASGRILFNSVLANFEPGPQDTWVNYHNDERPPLLFISGGEDHLMPPTIQRSNAKHYKSKNTITEVKVFDGFAHLLPAQAGWEAVADYALEWALEHSNATLHQPTA
jgi:pimeloyl-ACP methyl ester carboxylesterase